MTENGNNRWYDLEVPQGSTNTITLTNPTGSTINVTNAGYWITTTQVPLGNLDGTNYPVGTAPFSLPGLDGSLTPGASTPEPSSLTLLGEAFASLALVFAWRRLSNRKLQRAEMKRGDGSRG